MRMSSKSIAHIVQILRQATHSFIPPMTQTVIEKYPGNSYAVLISCLLSLRTKDLVTLPVSLQLFQKAKTPQEMLELSQNEIQKIIKPVNYYVKKSQQLHDVSLDLINRFNGQVPATRQELLSIKGVGIKTANLVLAEAFGIPAICVDIHVHRISNRLGIIATKTPEESEIALQAVLPQEYWIEWNRLLVKLGQNICKGRSPLCHICPVSDICLKIGL